MAWVPLGVSVFQVSRERLWERYGEPGRTDGVDIGTEKLRRLAPELKQGDAAGALGVGEDLDEVSCAPHKSASKHKVTNFGGIEWGTDCRSAR